MRRTSAPRLRNVSRHAVDVVRCARCIRFHDGRAHGPSSRHETDMRHAASSVPGPSKSVGSRQAHHESADVALCPRQARLRIDRELFVSWSTRNAALIAALVQRRRNALHSVEVIDAAAIVLLTRRRRRPVSSWRFFARARAAQARRVDEIIKEADAINQRVDAVVSPPRSSRTGDVITRGLLYLAISGTLPRGARGAGSGLVARGSRRPRAKPVG